MLLKPFWGKVVTICIILVGFLAAMLIMSPFMGVAGMLPWLLGTPIANNAPDDAALDACKSLGRALA